MQVSFLATHSDRKVLVYFLTCAAVDYYALILARMPKALLKAGGSSAGGDAAGEAKGQGGGKKGGGSKSGSAAASLSVHALHGKMKQSVREAALEAYTAQPAGESLIFKCGRVA